MIQCRDYQYNVGEPYIEKSKNDHNLLLFYLISHLFSLFELNLIVILRYTYICKHMFESDFMVLFLKKKMFRKFYATM